MASGIVNFETGSSVRSEELVAHSKIGIGTHTQTANVHCVADAPVVVVEDKVGNATQTALRITADGGTTHFQSGVDLSSDSKGDFKFQSMLGGTTHLTIDGGTSQLDARANVQVGTANLFVDTLNSRVGVGTDSGTGQMEIYGAGQTTTETFDQTGNMGGVLAVKSSDNSVGSGGAIMFGSQNGYHAAIKASLENGTDNTRGRLGFFARNTTTDSTMSHVMTIADEGRVGIGTTNPSKNLQVYGTSYPSLVVGGPNSDIRLVTDTVTPFDQVIRGSSNVVIEAPANSKRLYIDSTNGNVGFGTTVPDAKLHTRGTGQTNDTSFDTSQTLGASIFAQASDNDVGSGGSLVFGANSGKFAAIKAHLLDGNSNTVGDLHFMTRTSVYDATLTNRMTIRPGGGIGIGTTDPGALLHIHSDAINGSAIILESGGYESAISQKSYSASDRSLQFTNEGYGGANPLYKFLGKNSNNNWVELVNITGEKCLGIGTASPKFPLHAHGVGPNTSLGSSSQVRWFHPTHNMFNVSTGNNGNALGWSGISVYGSADVCAGDHVVAHNGTVGGSDERIKRNIVDADDTECLEVLRQLKPKKYQYKDVINKGETYVWGFIAQEVANVLPYSTQLRPEAIPNIYELANVSSSNVITFSNFNTANLEANATTIRVMTIQDRKEDVTVAEVIDEHTIRVEEDLTDWIGSVDETGNVVVGNQIFIYGQRVNDFCYLKKESIWTVATSALQEVDRQQQADKVRIAELESQLASVLARLDALENP